jgi:hypothetical protein
VCRPLNKASFGGKGVTISEVLNFLRSTSPKINYTRGSLVFGSNNNTSTINSANYSGSNSNNNNSNTRKVSGWQNEKIVSAVLADTHLVNGHALGVAFLGNDIVYYIYYIYYTAVLYTNNILFTMYTLLYIYMLYICLLCIYHLYYPILLL